MPGEASPEISCNRVVRVEVAILSDENVAQAACEIGVTDHIRKTGPPLFKSRSWRRKPSGAITEHAYEGDCLREASDHIVKRFSGE